MRRFALAGILVGLLGWCILVAEVDPARLWTGGAANVWELLRGFYPPDFTAHFVWRVIRLLGESIAIACLGMVLALAIGIPLALGATRFPSLLDARKAPLLSRWGRNIIRWVCRSTLSFFRSIPEIIWAFLFVRIFGLGPGPAVLAIGLAFGGIIGKLYAELMEAVDPVSIDSVRASGAGSVGVFLFAVFPQVRNEWIGYGLFRFECAMRSATILGIVGAGGIGSEMELAIRYFEYDKLATALLAVFLCIIVFERCSRVLRRSSLCWTIALFVIGATCGGVFLDIGVPSSFWLETGSQVAAFVGGLFPPATEVFVAGLLSMGQTVAMAVVATGIASGIAFVSAPFATREMTSASYLQYATHPRWSWRYGTRLFVRGVYQGSRSFPELVWGLIFVIWVGAGPFAGTLAVCVHTIGILGRLFAESYEEVDPSSAQLLESVGAGRIATWIFGVVPVVAPRLAGYALFRLEVNIRATAMMGFVGAGGIGNHIHTAISLFHMRDLAMLLILLLTTVIGIDALGAWARRSLGQR